MPVATQAKRARTAGAAIEWIVADAPVAYPDAVAWMEARAAAVAGGQAREAVWLVEHPALYTAGTSARADELLDARFPVHASGRGGRFTYHGPGQRIAYLVLDLSTRGRDVRAFVAAVEDWVVAALAQVDVDAWRAPGRVGIWTRDTDGQEAKIAAIGIRVRRWVTLHGLSINVAPNLAHFGGIVPCGLLEFGVTSLARLGTTAGIAEVDAALRDTFVRFLAPFATVPEN